jgi:hypothetical protein
MSTPVLPDYAAPYKPVPNVTPFTLRDGTTMLKKVDYINKYIERILIPWINENFSDLADAFETQVNALVLQVNTALAEQSENFDAKVAELETLIVTATSAAEDASTSATDAQAASASAIIAATNAAADAAIAANAAETVATAMPDLVIKPSGGNDQPLISAAIATAAATGRALRLAEGTFLWNTSGDPHTSTPRITGAGVDKTVIQLGAGVGYGPRFQGTKTQVGANNPIATVAKGSRTLTTAFDYSASLAAGDAISIISAKHFSTRAYYNEGEFATVKSITGDTITLMEPLRFGYATGDTIKIYKYGMLSAVNLSGFTVKANDNNVRQILLSTTYCEKPVIRDVKVSGAKADVGIEIQECRDALVERPIAEDIKGLGNLVINTWLGYGVHTTGSLRTIVRDIVARRCRHGFDDSSNAGIQPSLSTIVSGVAYDGPSAGFSTHGGSDECFFNGCETVQCGGGFALRGRAPRGRNIKIRGSLPSGQVNEYTAMGGDDQNYRVGVLIGEPLDDGTVNYAGTRVDWEFSVVDFLGASTTANVINSRYADLIDCTFTLGEIFFNQNAAILYMRSNASRNVVYRNGTIHNSGSGIALALEPETTNISPTHIDILIENIVFDGYNQRVINIPGSTDAAMLSKGIIVRNNKAKNKNAGYGAGSAIMAINGGYFDTAAGSVRVENNDFRESQTTAFFNTGANGGAGLSTGLTRKGNVHTTGYDTAP